MSTPSRPITFVPLPLGWRKMRRTLIILAAIGCSVALFFDEPTRLWIAVASAIPYFAYLAGRPLWTLAGSTRRSHWLQFGIRGLFIIVAVCAIGVFFWERDRPRRESAQFAAEVAGLGGRVEMTDGIIRGFRFNKVPFTDEDLAMLADLPAANRIKVIRLDRVPITDEGLLSLPGFTNAHYILIDGCRQLHDRSVDPLSDMPSLEMLVILNTPHITEKAIERLKQKRPDVKLSSEVADSGFYDPNAEPLIDPN